MGSPESLLVVDIFNKLTITITTAITMKMMMMKKTTTTHRRLSSNSCQVITVPEVLRLPKTTTKITTKITKITMKNITTTTVAVVAVVVAVMPRPGGTRNTR